MADSEPRRNPVEEDEGDTPAGEVPGSIASTGLQQDWELLSLSTFENTPPPPPLPSSAFPVSDPSSDSGDAGYSPSLGILHSQHFSCMPEKPDSETLVPSKAAPSPCTVEDFPIFAESVSRNYGGAGGGGPFQEEMVLEGGRNEAVEEDEDKVEDEEEEVEEKVEEKEESMKEEPVVTLPAAPAPDTKDVEGPKKKKEGKIGWLWRSCIEEHSTIWSVALAATVVGLAVLGYSWQKERYLSQDLRMQLSAQEKRISELSYQLANIRDAISGRRKLPVFRSRGAT